MEISHASVETASASVGISGKAEKVTVSTDAEFMMMIAHGIYSNKPLALVRELLCNARDGHIKAGTPDKPIIVTLTDNSLVVRDHGTGIPNDKFTPIYLTFGQSTKRKDKSATGGFGVGSKVPWAVTDTFSARNFIDGTMTAYSIVRSDPNADGEPSCTAIMTIPSTEPSGVEVTVPFPEKMQQDISNVIHHFADELGIMIELNKRLIGNRAVFKTDEMMEQGFVFLPHHPRTVIQQSLFYVRQGDVFYPIEVQEDFADAYNMLVKLSPSLRQQPMAFMALPDSIIPTLSRESLQYTERTSKSIRDLMKKALQEVADRIDDHAKMVMDEFPAFIECSSNYLRQRWTHEFNINEWLRKLPVSIDAGPGIREMLYQNMTQWLGGKTPYMETELTNGRLFRELLNEKLFAIFKKKLASYPYLNTERVLEYHEESRKSTYYRSASFTKHITRNLYEEFMFFREEMRANPDIVDVLFPANQNTHYVAGEAKWSGYFHSLTEVKDLDKKKEKLLESSTFSHAAVHTYLSNVVIISMAPSVAVSRALALFRGDRNTNYNFLTDREGAKLQGCRYIRMRVGAKNPDIERLATQLRGRGYEVITLLDPTKEELEAKAALAAERARLREIPLPTLADLIFDRVERYPANNLEARRQRVRLLERNPAFKGKPMYLMLGKGKDLPFTLNTFDEFRQLAKYVGTDIVCVSTKPELARMIKEGRVSVESVITDVARRFMTKPGMHERLFYEGTFFAKRTRQNKYLTKYLFNRAPEGLTDEEREAIKYFHSVSGLFPDLAKYMRSKKELYATNKIADHYAALFVRYSDDNFCDVHRALDVAYARRASPSRTKARAIMKTILKERSNDRP